MRIVGKYSFLKKDKNNNVIFKKQKYNNITKSGQQQILKLLSDATPINNFKDMVGYQAVDLSSYNLKPVFENGDTVIEKEQYKNYLLPNNYDQSATSQQIDWKDQFWVTQSSFFFNKKWSDANYLKLNSPVKNGYSSSYNQTVFKYYNVLTNEGTYSQQNVDRILSEQNELSVDWKAKEQSYSKYLFFNRYSQNIDFFRVFCRQKVLVYKDSQTIQLWKGNLFGENNNNQLNVVYKVDTSQSNFNRSVYNSNISFCFRAKYKKQGQTSFTYLYRNDVQLDEKKGTVKLQNSSVFPTTHSENSVQVILQYYVHYKDQQLKNGICGIYLNYSQQNDNSKINFPDRTFFGNGVFSSDAGKNWDKSICFPWCGNPAIYNNYYMFVVNQLQINSVWFRGTDNRDSSSLVTQTDSTYNKQPSLITTSQCNDNVKQHFYSFYPYLYKNATNFHFFTKIWQKLSIKNFLFLTPKLNPQVPRAFVFGSGNQKTTQQIQQLQDQKLKLDAIWCGVNEESSESSNSSSTYKLPIKWKTIIDFQDANDFQIKQIGLVFGNQQTKNVRDNWYCLKNVLKQDCNTLFSRVTLSGDQIIRKTDEQVLQVTYELEVK